VIFGQAHGIPNVNILGIDQRHDQGAVIVGGLEGDLFGSALSVGKISGDSSTDLVVGAYNSYADGGKIGAGAVYVVNGKTGFSNLNIRGIDQRPGDGLVINGCTIGDYFGISVAIGDFNGDGKHDILVGASGSYRGDGAAYVIWGKDNLSNIGICGINERPSDGVVLDGCTNGCPTATYQTGYSVGSGDINGDGIDDMIIGAPGMSGNQGVTYVVYGNKNGLSNMNLFSMSTEQGISISGASLGIRFGQAVSSFGKCLIVGAPSAADGKGQTSIICTGTSGSASPTTQPIEYPTSMPSPKPTGVLENLCQSKNLCLE
jgi:glycosylphosphatidylinositol phospholipase D